MKFCKVKRDGNGQKLFGILASYLFLILALFLLIIPAKTVLAQDWVVTGTEVVENDSITLNGDLIVESGGNLTLRTVTLTMNNVYNGQYGIKVKSGGVITIESASVITTASDSARFSFTVESGADFVMTDSELTRCGWGPDSEELGDNATVLSGIRGLTVDAYDAVIERNTFCNNYVGIILTGSGISLASNNIHSNKVHGIYMRGGSTCQITNNTIQHSSISSPFRIVEGESNTIKSNTISLTAIHRGVIETMWSHGNTFENNTIFGFGMGILMMFVSNNNLVKNNNISTDEAGIMLWGWNNRVEGNTISDSSECPSTGICMVYAYNSEIVGNNISGDTGDGIWLRHSSNNTIVNNQICAATSVESARQNGFLLMNNSKRNVIHGNSISGFARGISLFYSSDENTISGNEVSGVTLQNAIVDDSSQNLIYNNNFLDSGPTPYDNGQNQWDYEGRGNYWSDYGGSDTNGDGIGDEPYGIGPEGNDNYPAMAPIALGPLPAPAAEPAIPPSPGDVFGKTVTGEEVIEDQTIVLGALGVSNGGSLTLRNVILITGGTDRCSDLSVDSGGALYIDDCEITHLEYGYGFQMSSSEGSTYSIKNSILNGCGHEWPYGGLLIRAEDSVVENNEISDTIISFFGASGGKVLNNNISRSLWTINLEGADNMTIAGNVISKSIDGVIRGSGSGQTIKNNTITDFWGDGISMWQSSGSIAEGNHISGAKADVPTISLSGPDTTIKGNVISDCSIGIRTDKDSNTVKGNTISNCSVGLDMRWNNSLAEGNSISNCAVGIYVVGSGHTFVGNDISGCDIGINLDMGSSGNVIYHNNFVDNTLQAEDPWTNQWYFNGQGNYWSDYNGIDADGDGIGDTPYYIGTNGMDICPLMNPYKISRPSMPWIILLLSD